MSRTKAMPDTLSLLLAIERAGERNQGPREDDRYEYHGPAGSATVERIAEHLGWHRWWRNEKWLIEGEFPPERIRAACKRLLPDDLVFEHRPKHGSVHYGVAPEGEALLVAETDELPELPESPAHHTWRYDHEKATRRLPVLREGLREAAEAVLANVEVTDWREVLAERPRQHWQQPMGEDWTPSDDYLARHNLGSVVEERMEDLIEALKDLEMEEPA